MKNDKYKTKQGHKLRKNICTKKLKKNSCANEALIKQLLFFVSFKRY